MMNPASSDAARLPPAVQLADLLKPEVFTHPVTQLEVRETHISWVILTGTLAYKIKKPVKFDFIDTSTLEQRHFYCEEELRLNRRLAPELYVDVVPITCADGHFLVGGQGPAIEYAVRMKQFAAADELLSLLAAREVSVADMTALGELLARFHCDAPAAPWLGAPARTEQMYSSVLGNLALLIAHLEQIKPQPALGRLVDWTHENAWRLEAQFQLREQSGHIRECHGDLHAGNIVRSQGRLVPFDCIEFDPRLRWIDVISDMAFLVMDLLSHRRPDLGFALLSRYLEITGDYEGLQLLPYYAVYRALVRAKVDALAAEQVPQRSAEFRERLSQRITAASGWMDPQQPTLILMHGASGSGKSWLSERLVAALPAIRIRSDLERKRLVAGDKQIAGQAAGQVAGPSDKPERTRSGFKEGIYSDEFNHRTYARLVDCAERCLQAGFSAIVDATFLDAADRELFHNLAIRSRASFAIVSCRAAAEILSARVSERSRAGTDASEADLTILDTQLRTMRPFGPREQPYVIVVDTGAAETLDRVVAAIRCGKGHVAR